MTVIAADVRGALERTLAAPGGADANLLRLSAAGQLDPALYRRVNQILTNLGGVWVGRKAQAHVWPDGVDARAAVAAALAAGKAVHPDRVAAFFPTPGRLADDVARVAGIGGAGPLAVLEPSAGDGALVRAARRVNPHVTVTAVEPDPARAATLDDGSTLLFRGTFERFAELDRAPFDAVVMNPPFALPGVPAAWAAHVELAWSLLRPGGTLAAVVPAGMAGRTAAARRVRDLVAEHGGQRGLPDGSFARAGTGVRTCLIWADKPAAHPDATAIPRR